MTNRIAKGATEQWCRCAEISRFARCVAALLLVTLFWPIDRAAAQSEQTAATHRYDPVASAEPSAEAQALAARLGAEVEVLELRAENEERPIVRVEAAVMPDGGGQILGWQSLVPTPFLRRDIRADEELRLVEVLEKHLPEGSKVLAFPGTSRRLTALVSAEFPLAIAPEPLVMPQPWARSGDDVAAYENAYWGQSARHAGEGGTLDAFIDAMLAEDVNGAARLRILAGEGEAYVLLHLEDAFQLGQLRPGRMEMARRQFTAASFSHDLAREARRWAQSNDQAAWAVDRGPDGKLRGHFLSDPAETATLVAQLLPFNTSRIDTVPGLHLAWQWEGYWLYRIAEITDTSPSQ